MKLLPIAAMLAAACSLALGFPATTDRISFKETFDGGADAFDLDFHSLTLFPYHVPANPNQSRYPSYVTIRPIRELPVDMSDATTLEMSGFNGLSLPIAVTGLPTIHGLVLNNFQVSKNGEVILTNTAGTSSVALRVMKSDTFFASDGALKFEATYLQNANGKLTIQFDYSLDPFYEVYGLNQNLMKDIVRNTFQVEVFPTGMIRYSYFGVDARDGEVGLISSASSGTGTTDQNYSNAILRAPDVVVKEDAATASVALELAANVAANFSFQHATSSGSAVAPADYTTAAGPSVITTGTRTTSVAVPIINDTLGENPESLDLVLHAPTNPDWIFATPRIWIIDNDSAGSSAGPWIDLSGNRVVVLPPQPSAVTITGFRLLSLSGGTLLDPLNQTSLALGATFSLAAGAAGLISSGSGIHLTVEAIQAGGASASVAVGFDLDGVHASPVFGFTSGRVEVTEGGTASLGVRASQPGASAAYQILPLTAQPFANGTGDYSAATRALVFENGLARIEIPVFADGINEGAEEFMVRLVNPSAGSFIGPASRARVVIADGTGALRKPSDQRLPGMVPSGRSIRRDLTGTFIPNASQAWRLKGEPRWRPANSSAWNARDGLHRVELRANATAPPMYLAPDSYLNQGIMSGLKDLDLWYDASFSASSAPAAFSVGSLQVTLLPAGVAGRWRRLGETTWRNSGVTETNVPVVPQLVEFEDTASGYDAPSPRAVSIQAGGTASVTATYQPRPVSGASPVVLTEPDLRVSGTTWTHIPISAQTGDFKVSFEFKPTTGSNTFASLSSGTATSDAELSAVMRASASGFAGWNGTTYAASTTLALTPDQWHFVEFEVNPTASTYKLHITPPTGARVTVQASGVFRSASNSTYLSMQSTSGSATVRGLRVAKNPATSTWKIIEFPDQTGSFDIALELHVNDAPFRYRFHLTDGRVTSPAGATQWVDFPEPEYQGASGRYAPLAVRMHVDLATDTYQVRSGTDTVLASGLLPQLGLAKANHFYVAQDSDVATFTIADSVLPPAFAPPTGTGTNLPSHWTHLPIEPQTGRFSLTCDLRTIAQTVGTGDPVDSLLGISSVKVDQWNQNSVALRAYLPAAASGFFDAHTGGLTSGGFAREGDVALVDGRRYHAVFHVDVPNQTFRVEVSPEDGGPVVILQQGTFRQPATVLRYLSLRSVQGRLEVSNVRGPLPHPEDSPPYFTGQIETPLGFGTGTVVADHVVLTSARLVFDPVTLTFTRGITWRRSGGGRAEVPDACEPSHVVLGTDYAAVLLGSAAGDPHDVALLAFRPLDVPLCDNAPGGGAYSGFQIDDGTAAWSAPGVTKYLPSFPVSGVAAGNPGRIHTTAMGSATFTAGGNGLHSAAGIQTPPGSEGAALFVRGTDRVFRPAAVCVGSAGGVPRFRSIDSALAEAIHQANGYQRQPGFLQGLVKGGVYYIAPSLSVSAEPNRAHILSNALPPAAYWTLKRFQTVKSKGGQAVSVEPGSYRVDFLAAPPGFTGPTVTTLTKTLTAGTTWNLPAVYVAAPPSSYETWVAAHYDEFEARSAVSAPGSASSWLGIDNLTAYAFGFNPNGGPTPFATATTPGYPVVAFDQVTSPPAITITVELHRRINDPDLTYQIQYSDTLGGWQTLTTAPTVISTSGVWQRVRWSLPGQPGRKFVRTRVTLAE